MTVPSRFRGRPAPPGDHPPARTRAFRLTPENIGALLFDDVMWAYEGQGGARRLRRGAPGQGRAASTTTVSCSPRPSRCLKAGAFVLDRLCTPEHLGPSLVGPGAPPARGTRRRSSWPSTSSVDSQGRPAPPAAHSLSWEMLRADDFVLPPLPNHLFQRDNSCWIYDG